MKYADAFVLAEEAMNALKPFGDWIGMAGSIRRQRPEVKDGALVAILQYIPGGRVPSACG
jgi:hypothetical protein